MTDGLHVRRALLNLPEDAHAYRDMLNAYAIDPLGQDGPLEGNMLDKVVADLNDHPCCFPFLAFLDERAVGFATCFLGYSTFKAAPLMNIHDIAVLPDMRRRGIGRALIQAIAKQAEKIGCCRLTLEVRDDNPAAFALYQGNGFDVCRRGDQAVPYRFMERPLPAP